jgi:hypothetical protein
VAGIDRLFRLERPLLDALDEEARELGDPFPPARVPGDRFDEVGRWLEASGHGDNLGGQLRHLRRRRTNADAARFERFFLRLCRT